MRWGLDSPHCHGWQVPLTYFLPFDLFYVFDSFIGTNLQSTRPYTIGSGDVYILKQLAYLICPQMTSKPFLDLLVGASCNPVQTIPHRPDKLQASPLMHLARNSLAYQPCRRSCKSHRDHTYLGSNRRFFLVISSK